MDRTPSPPRRVRTPPAPLHGSKYDTYEPFSPRRSSRVAAQHALHQDHGSPTRQRSRRDFTPTRDAKKPATLTAKHALSPPSSPISPHKHHTPRSVRRSHLPVSALDSDPDTSAPTPARRLLSTITAASMFPTPSKTPRKRALHTEESLRPTARVLFANDRPATVEDAMPTPRKVHKSTRVFALDSFDDQMNESTGKIGVYVDSKERVPTREDDEDNPFLTRRGKNRAKKPEPKTRKMNSSTAKMFDAAARDEGIVYNFRGKAVLRKFEDEPVANDSDADHSAGEQVHRQADLHGPRRLTRSSIKPRLLFQEEIKRLEEEEEAPTDIETPMPTPSRKRYGPAPSTSTSSSVSVAQDTTPPPTIKRQISFNSWSRVKSSTRATSAGRDSRKRGGPPLESSGAKRARSEHEPSASSLDNSV